MNILLATEYFPESETGEITGGVESRAFYAARQLAKRHRVFILTSRRPGSKKTDSFSGLSIIRVGPQYAYTQSGHLFSRALFSISLAINARRLVRKEKIEVVDGYSFFSYPAALWATFLTKARGFLTYHEVWIGSWAKNTGTKKGVIGEIFERIVLLKAKMMGLRFIAVSGFTKEQLVKNGIPGAKISVISNGVTLSDYAGLNAKKAINPTICFVGRLTKNKRVEDLIKAASILRKKIKGIKVIILGGGPEEEPLKKLVRDEGLTGIVEFSGFLPSHREVLRRLKASTIFCSPSIVEGFGITLVEAVASGVPYVCSDIQPFKEISENGKGGLLFRKMDADDLAKKLHKLITDKDLYHKCVEEERRLSQKYGWEEIAKKMEMVYGEEA